MWAASKACLSAALSYMLIDLADFFVFLSASWERTSAPRLSVSWHRDFSVLPSARPSNRDTVYYIYILIWSKNNKHDVCYFSFSGALSWLCFTWLPWCASLDYPDVNAFHLLELMGQSLRVSGSSHRTLFQLFLLSSAFFWGAQGKALEISLIMNFEGEFDAMYGVRLSKI